MQGRGDDIWKAIEEAIGDDSVPAAVRGTVSRERFFQGVREQWSRVGRGDRERLLDLIVPFVRSNCATFEAAAQESARETGTSGASSPDPPWWRPFIADRFASLEPLQREAATILGLNRQLAVQEVEDVLGEQWRREHRAGDSLRLFYPVPGRHVPELSGLLRDSKVWTRDMLVYRGYYREDSGWDRERRRAARSAALDAVLSSDAPDHEKIAAMSEHIQVAREESLSGLTRPAVDASQPLSRIVALQNEVTMRAGCAEREATAYLLCGIIPDLRMARAWMPWTPGSSPKNAPRDRPIHMTIMSSSVPSAAVTAVYGEITGEASHGARRPAIRSAHPLLAANFVRDYKQKASPRTPGWPEMWEAFQTAHPGAYGSLESFRQTVYRQLGPSRESGQSSNKRKETP